MSKTTPRTAPATHASIARTATIAGAAPEAVLRLPSACWKRSRAAFSWALAASTGPARAMAGR
jgi:hypothetical protein